MKLRVIAVSAAIITLVCTLSSCSSLEPGLSAAELLEAGERNLLEQEYERALLYFMQIIKIETLVPRGYTGAAEARIGMGQNGAAIAVLQDGLAAIPGDADIQSMLDYAISREQSTVAPSSSQNDVQVDLSNGAPVSELETFITVPDNVLEISGRISEALLFLDFETAWELSSDEAIMSFIRQVSNLNEPWLDTIVFKFQDVVFTLVSPELPNEYEHFSSERISIDSNGNGEYTRFTMNTYGSYEYPTYEVFTVSGNVLTGAYALYSFPGGWFNDEVSRYIRGQTIEGKFEGTLTREVTYNHGGVMDTEEEWNNGENAGYPGGPFPAVVPVEYIQYIAGLPNW